MNTQILNKCIEELKKETPDLSYIRGILETLVDSTPIATTYSPGITYQPQQVFPGVVTTSQSPDLISDEERQQQELAYRYTHGPTA